VVARTDVSYFIPARPRLQLADSGDGHRGQILFGYIRSILFISITIVFLCSLRSSLYINCIIHLPFLYLILVFGLFNSPKKGEESDSKNVAAVATEKAAAVKVSTEPGFKLASTGCTALVTGSSGLCGARLVEMLLLRGAKKVIAFDVAAPNAVLAKRFADVQKETGGTIVVCSNARDTPMAGRVQTMVLLMLFAHWRPRWF
jgi:hypothetical protein